MSTERRSKKRKTQFGCSGIELISALHIIQKFRDKIKTEDVVGLNDINFESFELDIKIDKDALVQLGRLLGLMDSKIQSTKKYVPGCLSDLSDFTLGPEPRVLIRQLDTRERYPDYCESTTFSQR